MIPANDKFGNGGEWRRKKRYSPIERTAIKALEIIAGWGKPLSIYRLKRLLPGSQRHDRVILIVRLLEESGWIEAVGNPPRYKATEAGKAALLWGEKFIDFSVRARSRAYTAPHEKPQPPKFGDDRCPMDG